MTMTAEQIAFNAARKPVNNSQVSGLVDIARAQPNLEGRMRSTLAAPVTHTPAAGDITSDFQSAQDGDTIQLPEGTCTAKAVSVRAINVRGAGIAADGSLKSKLKFSTGGNFAISAAANAVFDLIDMTNNGGLIQFPNGSGMAQVTRCGLQFNGSGSNAVGVRSLNGNSKLKIDQCYFHDSPSSYRDCDLYGQGDVLYTNNEFEGTCYGAHIDGPKTGTVTVTGNVGTKWNRNMGIEIQDHGQTDGVGAVIFSNNCFYGFGPGLTNNTYLASVPVQNTGKLTIQNNYLCLGDFDANGNYHEAPLVGGNDVGIGLEGAAGPNRTICTGNTVIGHVCASIVTCQPGMTTTGNIVYGNKKDAGWGDAAFSGEPGNHGNASFVPSDPSTANTIIETIDANTPKPPRRVTRQPWNTNPTPPTQTMTLTPSNIGLGTATLTFANVPAGAAKPTIKFTDAANTPVPIGSPDASGKNTGLVSVSSFGAINLHGFPLGWHITATPTASGVVGTPVTFQVGGVSDPNYQPHYNDQISEVSVTPPPVQEQPNGVESVLHYPSGKTQSLGTLPIK